ncbi:MAG: cardiolipin synthase ClsB [Rubrivivax sp.]
MPVPLDDPSAWAWSGVPRPHFVGGNDVRLLQGGDELFPRMVAAIEAARHEVWLATYIFHSDDAARAVAAALSAAAGRGVEVNVVVDGFGSLQTMATLREWLRPSGVRLEVFRPLDRWWAWLQPGQMRRLHTKLCVVDSESAYVGGINVIDDRHDLHHGWSDAPRLDYAVELRGPIAQQVRDTARAMWARAHLGHFWGEELRALARSAAPVEQTVLLLRQLRTRPQPVPGDDGGEPVRAAFVVRDNLRQRRAIERSYVEAIRGARERVDIAVPYFYPGQTFRRALRRAAARGVRVRLLLQGKIDYRIAALAARALYDELRAHGVRIYEYTPAFLHAKVAVVDDDWATVGSSNIDPLSLLLNLEANVVVRDPLFARALADRLDSAIDASREVKMQPAGRGWRSWLHRGFVAWCASVYLRLAGIGGRY